MPLGRDSVKPNTQGGVAGAKCLGGGSEKVLSAVLAMHPDQFHEVGTADQTMKASRSAHPF